MTTEEAVLDLYLDYVALKAHFSGAMEFHENSLRGKIGVDQVVKRSDFGAFLAVVKRFGLDRETNLAVLVTLFLINPTSWIGDCLTMDFSIRHNARLKVLGNLPRVVSREAAAIHEFAARNSISFREMFFSTDTPYIIKNIKRIQGGITDETLAIADSLIDFTNGFTVNPWWRKRKFVLNRYAPLVAYKLSPEFINQEFSHALS